MTCLEKLKKIIVLEGDDAAVAASSIGQVGGETSNEGCQGYNCKGDSEDRSSDAKNDTDKMDESTVEKQRERAAISAAPVDNDKNKNNNSGHRLCPPHEFLCPITSEIMKDPVIDSDGFTYERMNILKWTTEQQQQRQQRHSTNQRLVPNRALQTMIYQFMGPEWSSEAGQSVRLVGSDSIFKSDSFTYKSTNPSSDNGSSTANGMTLLRVLPRTTTTSTHSSSSQRERRRQRRRRWRQRQRQQYNNGGRWSSSPHVVSSPTRLDPRRIVGTYLKEIGKSHDKSSILKLNNDGICSFKYQHLDIVIEVPESTTNNSIGRSFYIYTTIDTSKKYTRRRQQRERQQMKSNTFCPGLASLLVSNWGHADSSNNGNDSNDDNINNGQVEEEIESNLELLYKKALLVNTENIRGKNSHSDRPYPYLVGPCIGIESSKKKKKSETTSTKTSTTTMTTMETDDEHDALVLSYMEYCRHLHSAKDLEQIINYFITTVIDIDDELKGKKQRRPCRRRRFPSLSLKSHGEKMKCLTTVRFVLYLCWCLYFGAIFVPNLMGHVLSICSPM